MHVLGNDRFFPSWMGLFVGLLFVYVFVPHKATILMTLCHTNTERTSETYGFVAHTWRTFE